MDPERTRYVVTAWRNNRELLQLREDLYSLSISRREKAVNKVFAWRLRKPDGLPLMLDSTADIVDVVVQDERGGLAHNRLRLLYSTALSRCVQELINFVTLFHLARRSLHPLFIGYSKLISSPPTNTLFTDP
jgi:hypothetical protein